MTYVVTNEADGVLASSITTGDTSLSVTYDNPSASINVPGGDHFYAVLGEEGAHEVVQVTAVSGSTWTVVRDQGGTLAAHDAGARVKYVLPGAEVGAAAWPTGDGRLLQQGANRHKSLGVPGAAVYNGECHIARIDYVDSTNIRIQVWNLETGASVADYNVRPDIPAGSSPTNLNPKRCWLRPDGCAAFLVTVERASDLEVNSYNRHGQFLVVVDLSTLTAVIAHQVYTGGKLTPENSGNSNYNWWHIPSQPDAFDMSADGRVLVSNVMGSIYHIFVGDPHLRHMLAREIGGVSESDSSSPPNYGRPQGISPDGRHVVLGGEDTTFDPARLVKYDYNETTGTYEEDPRPSKLRLDTWVDGSSFWDDAEAMAVNKDGTYAGMFVNEDSGGQRVFLFDFAANTNTRIDLLADHVEALLFCGANDEYLISVGQNSAARAWDIPSGSSRANPLDGVGNYTRLFRSLDGRVVVAINHTTGECAKLEVDTWTVTALTTNASYADDYPHVYVPGAAAPNEIDVLESAVEGDMSEYNTSAPATDKVWAGGL